MANVLDRSTLEDLIPRYDTFLLDAYGVFWGSAATGLLPGAKEAMEALVNSGKRVGILSNTTQLAEKEKLKLAKWDVIQNSHYHFIVTSGTVTRQALLQDRLPFPTPRKSYCLFGTDHPHFSPHSSLFEGTSYRQVLAPSDADFMYLAIPHIDGSDQEDPEAFETLTREAARFQLPVLCANPDRFAHEGEPARPVVRQGTIAQMLQNEGTEVHFIGKPHSLVFREALAQCGAERILMIGDTPETDIRGARMAGIDSALITQTGIASERISKSGMEAFLRELAETDQPHFMIPRFSLDC
ncbi:MAG: TIGR01459 family HAD-type hydrolase [Chlamydiota bacterium]